MAKNELSWLAAHQVYKEYQLVTEAEEAPWEDDDIPDYLIGLT